MARELIIGVAIPDLSEYTALDPSWGIGDPRRQCEAALAGWRGAGRLPVHGRDMQLAFRSYRSNQPDEKVAAASALIEEDGAFAVLGGRDFTEGALWLAAAGVPVIDVNAVPTTTLAGAAPWMFTLRAAQDVLYRAFVRWADRGGHLAGRAIGVFNDRLTRESTMAALAELAALGHDVRTVVDSEGVGAGSERDEDAPARFQSAGVDLLLGFVGGSSWINTLRACARRGYRPALLDLETGEHTNDVTARFHPAELYDGTLTLAMSRVGDLAAGWPLAQPTERAVVAYERATGSAVERVVPVRSGEWSNLLITADLVALLLAGLEAAGPDPTRAALVSGLEQVRTLPMASGADVSYGPGEHWGFRAARTVQWDADRATWVARSDFNWPL
jgi:ABC-type branched-subunit amino acid transport system substrate-binding protein